MHFTETFGNKNKGECKFKEHTQNQFNLIREDLKSLKRASVMVVPELAEMTEKKKSPLELMPSRTCYFHCKYFYM